jgi:hypothetical protein
LVKRSRGRCRLGLGLGFAAIVLGGSAGAAVAMIDELAFERFMEVGRPVCSEQPAPACVALAWGFADSDGDEALSVAELAAIRTALEGWALRHQDELAAVERSGIALGLLLVDAIGLERLHTAYDADADGLISQRELLADVRLDQRPLAETLLDPAALDRAAIARRLGLPPALIERLGP